MMGKVEELLVERIRRNGTIHLTLIDPEKIDAKDAADIVRFAEEAGTAGTMIGGSTLISVYQLDSVVKEIKSISRIPAILFPNDVTGISEYADAIFFMSLLNSSNPRYIIEAQALGAPLVKRYGLETIPLGYLIVGENTGAAGYIGHARAIPSHKPELAAMYALAAQYLGMRFVYLEAGSGARKPIRPEMIRTVKNSLDIPLIVGGGIRTPHEAEAAAKAGADVIVTGSIVEGSSLKNMRKIIDGIRHARSHVGETSAG